MFPHLWVWRRVGEGGRDEQKVKCSLTYGSGGGWEKAVGMSK
jgi:hypothetical protein